MARINIEDKWWGDPRRSRLIAKLGSELLADGAFIAAIKLAQTHWIPNKSPIPIKAWRHSGIPDAFIEVGLAEVEGDGVYLCGSNEHFDWWFKKQLAGRNGGLKKASNAKQCYSSARHDYSDAKQNLPSSSSSSSKENTTTKKISDEISRAWKVWNETLAHFKIPKASIAPPQENSIARAINQLGLENVLLALEGARYEPSNETFSPKNHLSVDRVLHRDGKGQSRWEKLANLAREKQAKRIEQEEFERQFKNELGV